MKSITRERWYFEINNRTHNLCLGRPPGIVTCTVNNSDALRQVVAVRMESQGRLKPEDRPTRAAFDAYFAGRGLRSTSAGQTRWCAGKGLPYGSVMFQEALLLSEVTTGLLMGAQDAALSKEIFGL